LFEKQLLLNVNASRLTREQEFEQTAIFEMAVIIYTSYIAPSSILEINIPQPLRDHVKVKLLSSSIRIACSAVQVYDSFANEKRAKTEDSSNSNTPANSAPSTPTSDKKPSIHGNTLDTTIDMEEEEFNNNNGIDHTLFEKVEAILMLKLMDAYHRFYRFDNFKNVLEDLASKEKVPFSPTVTINAPRPADHESNSSSNTTPTFEGPAITVTAPPAYGNQ